MAGNERWAKSGVVAELLGRDRNTVRLLAKKGVIRVNEIPGARPLYSLDDARKYALTSIGSDANQTATEDQLVSA